MSKILLSEVCKNLKRSEMQNALKRVSGNELISFALGMPSTNLLPLKEYQDALNRIIEQKSLQYSEPSPILKQYIADLMLKRSIYCKPEQVFLTSGAQQAMMLITRLLVDKGDDIIVDDATYPGFIQIAKSFQANLVSISTCKKNGISMDSLETYLKNNKKPKMFYTMSEGHNPLGISLDKELCTKLANIIGTYEIPVIEDDAYGLINYENPNQSLKYFVDDWVFYIGSFSKILSPSIRVGWIIAPPNIMEKFEILKETSDINTATLSQHILASYLKTNNLDDHLNFLRGHYKSKRDAMVNALKKYLPEAEFISPKSGFFIWCKLPNGINTEGLFKFAVENLKISFLPGKAFSPDNANDLNNYLRLSFAFCDINLIESGIKKLAAAIELFQGR